MIVDILYEAKNEEAEGGFRAERRAEIRSIRYDTVQNHTSERALTLIDPFQYTVVPASIPLTRHQCRKFVRKSIQPYEDMTPSKNGHGMSKYKNYSIYKQMIEAISSR